MERFASYKLSYKEALQDVRRAEARKRRRSWESEDWEDKEELIDSMDDAYYDAERPAHYGTASFPTHGSANEDAYGENGAAENRSATEEQLGHLARLVEEKYEGEWDYLAFRYGVGSSSDLSHAEVSALLRAMEAEDD